MPGPDPNLATVLLVASALLGSAALGVSALVALRLARLRTHLDATRDALLARVEAAQRQRDEGLRLEVFVRAMESAEAGTRSLITYSQLMAEHATSVVFDEEGKGFRQTPAEIAAERAQAEKTGLFLPPELDRPFQRALKAIVSVQVAAETALKLGACAERKELCRPAVIAMDQEVLTFLNTSRVWKKKNWFLATTGEEAAPEAFADATSPYLVRPKGLFREDNGATR